MASATPTEGSEVLFLAMDLVLASPWGRPELLEGVEQLKSHEAILDVQPMRPRVFLSQTHLSSAAWHAWRAFEDGRTIANHLSVEFLLYASGQRQIRKALKYFGLEQQVAECTLALFLTRPTQRSELVGLVQRSFSGAEARPVDYAREKDELVYLARVFDYPLGGDAKQWKAGSSQKLENFVLANIGYLSFEAQTAGNASF